MNFYSASEVLSSFVVNTYHKNYWLPVQVDHYGLNPFFFYSPAGKASSFPINTATGASETNSVVIYAPYNSSYHRLTFTDTLSKFTLLDTTVAQVAQSFNCVYLVDKPAIANSIAAYRVISVKEDRTDLAPDKMGVRFIHLSPDAGDMSCTLQKSDGGLTNILPQRIKFSEASAYYYFSAEDAVSGLLLFSLTNPQNGTVIPTGVPYNGGRRYVVIISGYSNDQVRQFPTGKNSDGTYIYTKVSIARNLRSTLRRIY